MAKISAKGLLSIAVVLSLITSVMIYNYLKVPVATKTKDAVSVVVAKVDIPPKTKITSDMVKEVKVPVEYIQPNAMQDAKSVVGVIAREQIMAGEQITERRLVIEGKSVGFTGIIPRDKRAVTLAVNDVTGVAGFIKAGDYVDVIVTFDQNEVGDNVSHVVMQNILVLATNRETNGGVVENSSKDKKDVVNAKGMTITVAVSPDESAQLALMDEKGKVRMALRPYLPSNSIAVTNIVTPKDIVGVQFSPINKQAPGAGTKDASKERPPAYNKPAAAPGEAKPQAEGKGIQMIRGTKVETIPVN